MHSDFKDAYSSNEKIELELKVRMAMVMTGRIQIRNPFNDLKTFHRKPIFKKDGVYIRFKKGQWKVVDYEIMPIVTTNYKLTIFKVE